MYRIQVSNKKIHTFFEFPAASAQTIELAVSLHSLFQFVASFVLYSNLYLYCIVLDLDLI